MIKTPLQFPKHPDIKKVKQVVEEKLYKGKEGKEAFINALKYVLESASDKNSEILEGKISISYDKDFNHIYKIKLRCGFKLY